MNRLIILFLFHLFFSFNTVWAQDQNNPIIYNPIPIYSDNLDYITTTTEYPFYQSTRANTVAGSEFTSNNSIFKSGTVYKAPGGVVLKGGTSNKLTSIDLNNILTPEDTSIDSYYIRFNFKVRSMTDTGTQVNVKFFQSTGVEFVPVEDSRFPSPSKNYSITSTYNSNNEELDIEIQLNRNKVIKYIEIKPVDNFPGLLIDEVNVYTSASPSKITKFDGYRWTNGTPNMEKDVVFDVKFPYVWNDELTANSLKINPNNDITIASGVTVKLNNELIVDETSNLTFLEGAYLLQYNEDAVNVGNATFYRSTKPMFRLQSNLWSSPVKGLKLVDFSPRTLKNRFYTYDSYTDLWANLPDIENATFEEGIGYSIRVPNNFNNYTDENSVPKIFQGVFKGVPMNGYLDLDLENYQYSSRYHLIGNPYPSPLIVNTLFDLSEDIESVEIFKHNIPIDFNTVDGSYLTNDNQYFVINRGGSNDPGEETFRVDIGQAFFVKTMDYVSYTTISLANLYFRYEPEDDMFYDPDAPVIAYRHIQPKIEDKLWLALNSATHQISSISIGFSDFTSDDLDGGYDSKSIDSDFSNGLYTILNNENYVIQNYGPFNDSKIIPLNLKVTHSGEYRIDLTGKKGILETQSIYLHDSYRNIFVDLNENNNYLFLSEAGEYNDRFQLVFKNTLSTLENNKSPLSIYTSNQSVTITSDSNQNMDLKIVDITGQLITTKRFKNKVTLPLPKGVYILEVENNGKSIMNKKVIIN